MKEISDKAEFDDLVKSGKFVLVDFHAQWCGPCKMIAPSIEALSQKHTSICFCKVDVDDGEEIAAERGISAMPTFKLYKDGKEVAEVIGASIEKVEDMIKTHVK